MNEALMQHISEELNELMDNPGTGNWTLDADHRYFFTHSYAKGTVAGERRVYRMTYYVSLMPEAVTENMLKMASFIAERTTGCTPMLTISMEFTRNKRSIAEFNLGERKYIKYTHCHGAQRDDESLTVGDWTFYPAKDNYATIDFH